MTFVTWELWRHVHLSRSLYNLLTYLRIVWRWRGGRGGAPCGRRRRPRPSPPGRCAPCRTCPVPGRWRWARSLSSRSAPGGRPCRRCWARGPWEPSTESWSPEYTSGRWLSTRMHTATTTIEEASTHKSAKAHAHNTTAVTDYNSMESTPREYKFPRKRFCRQHNGNTCHTYYFAAASFECPDVAIL